MEIKIDCENTTDVKIDSKKDTKLILSNANIEKKQIKDGRITFALFEDQITPRWFWGKCPKCKTKNSIIGLAGEDGKSYWYCQKCKMKVPKKYRLRKDCFYIGDLRIELK